MRLAIDIEARQWAPGRKMKGVEEQVYDPHEGYTIPQDVGYVISRKSEAPYLLGKGDWLVTWPDGKQTIETDTWIKANAHDPIL